MSKIPNDPVIIKLPNDAKRAMQEHLESLQPKVTTTDRKTYERCLDMFRQVCIGVRELTGKTEFRGGYDEWAKLAFDPNWNSNSSLAVLKDQALSLNSLIGYEAGKLGIFSPDWWKECWADELTPQQA